MKINGKDYYSEYFCKCEFCDLNGEDGECMLPENCPCEFNEIFKLTEHDLDKERIME